MDVSGGTTPPAVAVAYDRRGDRDAAETLARELGLPVARGHRDPHPVHLLRDRAGRLALRVNDPEHACHGGHDVAVDLLDMDVRSPAGRRLDAPLLRAAGIRKGEPRRPHVIDATAGLGEDTWLLAAHGCRVDAVERDPVIHALLADGLRRAAEAEPKIAGRIQLHLGDATAFLTERRAEVVVLDPMFPAQRKAAERKPMRVLRLCLGGTPDTDPQALFDAAASTATRRVIVKRPRHAPPLVTSPAPAHAHTGRGFRFDLYPIHAG